jgi:CubicO group peptidase (beta-lactamase class C family)
MPRMRHLITLALIFTTQIGHASAQTAISTRLEPPRFTEAARADKLRTAFPEIDLLFSQFAEKSHVPGIAWGIVIDGALAHSGAHGHRDVAAKAPVDADTVFRIASMTKSFTALCILKLRDEGKLSLDDPAERYVPELKNVQYPTADSPRVTIRHLLSHAEGWPEDNAWGDRQLAVSDEQMNEMLRRGIPFSNAPGLAYEYSNFGFAVLGRIVSRVSGVPYSEYVAANILRPLGMSSTTMEPRAVPRGKLALGYKWENGEWTEEPQLADGAFGPMGGMLTSIRDLSRYVAFHLAAWPPRDDRDAGPVRRASVREMQQVWRMAPTVARRNDSAENMLLNAGGYGFGLRISQTCDFSHVVAHSGGLPGFGSQMRWLPEHGLGIIALGNLTYTSWGAAIDRAVEALQRTGGLKPRAVQPSPALADARAAVTRLVTAWDDHLADRIAADNLFLDRSKELRRKDIEQFHAELGTCQPEDAFEVENALRGRWLMKCDRGMLRVAITLAPTMPPKVQVIDIAPYTPSQDAGGTCR